MSRSRKASRVLPSLFVLAVSVGSCDSTEPRGPGSISVSSTVQSQDIQFFEYGIAIDNGTPRRAFAPENLVFTENGLAHGQHMVSVVDVPPACTGTGSRSVTLQGNDTAAVIFTIVCPRVTGDVQINVTTTGNDLDPDGYVVTLGGFPGPVVPTNGSITLNSFPPGTYTFGLGDVEPNCTAPASQTVTVTVGQLSTLNFSINCTAVGVLRFVTSVSGEDRDPDGMLVTIDNVVTPISMSGTTDVRVFPVGTRSYTVSDQQPNCAVTGPLSGTHTVGAGDTVIVTLSASCATIATGTAGPSVTDPAADTLPNSSNAPVQANDVVTISSRYAPGFLILTMRFARTVTPHSLQNPGGLVGYLELDTDESVSTGQSPIVNAFGGQAAQGIDFGVVLSTMDSVSMTIFRVTNDDAFIAGRVRARFQADSVVVFFPLNKLNDDGKLTTTAAVGTRDRPTDIVPNTGQILLQPPAGPMIAIRASQLQPPRAMGPKVEYPPAGTWWHKR